MLKPHHELNAEELLFEKYVISIFSFVIAINVNGFQY